MPSASETVETVLKGAAIKVMLSLSEPGTDDNNKSSPAADGGACSANNTARTSSKRSHDAIADSDDDIDDHGSDRRRKLGHTSPEFDYDLRDCVVGPNDINTTFEDVYVSESILEALDSLAMPFLNPQAFTFGVLSRCPPLEIFLYGPPGTGKTLLVKALAKDTKAKMITVTDADIRSKYVGDGERKIQQIFANARRMHPCIVFINEADSILGSRMNDNATRGHTCELSQFLTEMDEIKSDRATSPMIIAATNRPYAIDEGILRRLGTRIMVSLPDATAREKILAIHLRDEPLARDVDLAELTRNTPGYTGSDLAHFVTVAARHAERDNMERMGIKTRLHGRGASPQSSLESPLATDDIPKRLTNKVHFLRAKNEVHAAPITETVSKIREFDNMHGSTGFAGGAGSSKVEIMDKSKPVIIS